MAQQKEQPKIFDWLENYLVAMTVLDKKNPTKSVEFYAKVEAVKAQLDVLIDTELNAIADSVKI